MNVKRLSRISLAVAAALTVGQAFAATRGGQMVFGRYADSLFLDPVLNDANLDIWILTNLYDTLLQPTNDGKGVQPGLASSYTTAKDGKSMVLTLRPGLKFADGSALTAGDVKWSLDRARNPEAGAWNSSLASISSITASGNKVTLNLKQPDPTLPAALATFTDARSREHDLVVIAHRFGWALAHGLDAMLAARPHAYPVPVADLA